MKKKLYTTILLSLLINNILAIDNFTDISASIEPLRSGSCQWGDFNNDKLMDFFVTGRRDSDNLYYTGIYVNQGNGDFALKTDELPGVAYGKSSWGDYDNDGDLDILISGYNGTFNDDIVAIYRNDGGTFESVDFEFNVRLNKAVWSDVDNDGDLDIFANSSSTPLYILYRNLGNDEFEEITIDVTKKMMSGDLQFVDYNSDGFFDLFITGQIDDNALSLFYTNDGDGNFTIFDPGIMDVWNHSHLASFGDLDSDGDLDLILGGQISTTDETLYKTKIYQNNGGGFAEVSFALPNFSGFSSTLGDLDNDGDLDIVCGGYNSTSNVVRIFQNDGDFNFTEIANDFVNAADGCYDLADFDNDGDLDLLLIGTDGTDYFANIYRNDIDTGNNAPRKPLETLSNVTDNNVVLAWTKVLDTESKRDALSYNVYVGTESMGNQLVSSHSMNEGGKRLISAIGNAGQSNKKELRNLPAGKYFWAVQSIDNNFQGSEFSSEKSFEITEPAFIEITSPNGGEEYEVGDEMVIQWNSKDIEKVRISITANNGSDWMVIAENIENSGEYRWQVKNLPSDQCKIRVVDIVTFTSTAAEIIGDTSDNTFTIKDSFLPEVSVENHNNILPINGVKELQVHAQDAAGIRKVEINYRKGGDDSYTNSLMTTEDTQNFYFTLTSTMLTRFGLEYYVVATDSNGNSNETDVKLISIYCNEGIQNLSDVHTGNQGTDYRFFSIPLVQEDNSAESFFNDNSNIGKYDKEKIRLYGFKGTSQEWVEYPDLQDLKLGAGYAMLTTIEGLKLQSGKGTTVPITNDAVIPLVTGWNIIGNPYNHNIPVEKIEFSNGNFELWNFQGNWQEATSIKPWAGYAIYVENSGDLTIHSSQNSSVGKAAMSFADYYWQSTIELSEKGESLGEYKFGQHEKAKIELDNFDRHCPPSLPGQISLKFIANGKRLSKDFHEINNDFDQWNFQIIKSGNHEMIELRFEDLPQINSDWDIFLVDQDVKIAYNLKEENNVDLRLRSSNMNFSLVMGKKEIIKDTFQDVTLYPDKFVLYPNFPNPFNPATQINYSLPENSNVKIEIFNLKGEKVETLINDFKAFGNYSVVWNADKYSSGAYMIKMQAGKYIKIQKCMLIK